MIESLKDKMYITQIGEKILDTKIIFSKIYPRQYERNPHADSNSGSAVHKPDT